MSLKLHIFVVVWSFGGLLCRATALDIYTVSQKSSHLITLCNFDKY